MELLGQDDERRSSGGSKKRIVIYGLIAAIISLVFLVLIIVAILGGSGDRSYAIYIDDNKIKITEGFLITDEEGNIYISIEGISSSIEGFKYYSGEYNKVTEDKDYCYIENEYEVVGFETDSNIIYKTVPNSVVEYQYYEISKNIINSEGKLYIFIDDLKVACNVAVNQIHVNNETRIYTSTFFAEKYTEELFSEAEENMVSPEYANRKAIAYDMIVVSMNGRYGVIDPNLGNIIGTKYKKLLFNEFDQTFIATSTGNKVGVIDKDGEGVIELKYDGLRVISYQPLLYEVKYNSKFGVIDEYGNIIVGTEYDSLGYKGNNANEEAVLIIPKASKNQDGIVVCKGGKYGMINIKNGETIFDCDVEAIYSKTDENNDKTYYITIRKTEVTLQAYIEYVEGNL